MRELKFRVFYKNNFTYFDLDLLNDESRAFYINEIKGNQVMQYTGLKDKNGVEIYEGDIVKGVFKYNKNKEIAIVEYGEIDVSDEYDDESVMGYFCENHCLGSHLELEVKGNIYENPELLKS